MFRAILSAVVIALFPSAVSIAALPSHPNSAEAARLDESSCDDGFSFVVMADSHTGTPFETIVAAAGAMKPDFAISVGDITSNGTTSEYELFLSRISRASIPWFVAPGNHEYRSPSGRTSLAGRQRFARIFGKGDFFFDHCGWRFVGLDVVAMDMLLNPQIIWLDRSLEGFEGRSVVFTHYPPAVVENWEEGLWKANGREFLDLLQRREVRYLFSGHIHVYDRLQLGPTTAIITGCSGGDPDVSRPVEKLHTPGGGAFHHFVHVTVKGDTAIDSLVRPAVLK